MAYCSQNLYLISYSPIYRLIYMSLYLFIIEHFILDIFVRFVYNNMQSIP